MERSANIYQFGECRFEPSERRLWLGAREIKLRPKLLDLLALFVQRPSQLLDKDELLRQLWPDAIVEENNLTVTVNGLRAALPSGDFIETVARRGYRFTADVKMIRFTPAPSYRPSTGAILQPPGGALPLGSPVYIKRPADDEFNAAIERLDSIVLVKGARQVGKTSLLARGLESARRSGP